MTAQIPDTLEAAAPLLVARPVGLVPLAVRRLTLALQDAESALDAVNPIIADYGIGVYLDLPEANIPVTDGLLRDWGTPLAGAIDLALLNGRAALSQASRQDRDGAVHLTSDFLGAAILSSSETIRGLIEGPMLVIMPTASDVLVAPIDDPVAVEAVVRLSDDLVAASERTVSVTPLTVTPDGAWAPADWPSATAKTAGLLHRRWLSIQYARQRDPLRRTYEDQFEFLPVSSMTVAQRPDGWTITRSNLTSTVPTLMPWSDEAVIVDDSGRTVVAPMTQLAAMPGTLVREPDVEPPIMRALRFPAELFD